MNVDYEIEIRTNYEKYNKVYGSAIIESGTVRSISRERAEEIARMNAEKEVCLHCTRSKCKGTRGCVAKERRKKEICVDEKEKQSTNLS